MMRSATALALALALWAAQPAWASGRAVVVNGAPMGADDLAVLDALAGEPIPDGRYWLDVATGLWGYEGGPAQGVLGGEDLPEPGPSGGSGKRYYEDYVDDFCARHGGC